MVERRPEEPCVGGSSPSLATTQILDLRYSINIQR